MTSLSRHRVAAGALALALAACAGPRAAAPPPAVPAATPPAAAAPVPPPAEEIESFPLVREHPAVAAATAALAAGPAAERPAQLLRRAREAIAAAQRIRAEQGTPVNLPSWAPDHDRFLAFYDLAIRDLDELLATSPDAPEAAEALFTMGMAHDYPHLDLFDVALEAYHATIQRYPGTVWAQRAVERIQVIGGFMEIEAGPHGNSPR